jgi:glycosyltransferase involved in cell wall biosynthesis
MKAWIRDFDFVRFREELSLLTCGLYVVSSTEYANFTGARGRIFFDHILDKSLEILGRPASGTSKLFVVVPKAEVATFFEEIRCLNTALIEYRYLEQSPNLFLVEISFEISKCQQPVTVIVPCFNSELSLLEKTVSSVVCAIDQTAVPEACQLIIIDDCSANSAEIQATVKRLFESDSRVQYLRMSENRGVSSVRNYGIATSRSEIVMFVDHDDIIETSHINLLAQEIVRKQADIAVSNMRFPDKHLFCAHLSAHRGFLLENGFGSGIAINKGSTRVKSLLGTGELYNNKSRSHFEDWELNSVAKLLAWKISIVPYASYFYTYMPTGRDSTNLSLKRRAGLATPLYAIDRVKQLSRENAYSHLKEYTESLIEQIIASEERWALERQGLLERCAAMTQVTFPNHVTIHGFAAGAVPLNPPPLPRANLVARAKFFVKDLEQKLSSSKVLSAAYKFTLRPALYATYRSLRFMYRLAAGKHVA